MFNTGQLLFSRGVYHLLQESSEFSDKVFKALRRHKKCDWGDCPMEDKSLNDKALKGGQRLFSVYSGPPKFYIITEWDRSATTVLFPEEY